MELDDVLDTLRRNESLLKGMGIVHAGVFGSVARGEADKLSDVDIVLSVDSARRMGLTGLLKLEDKLEEILASDVSVVTEPVRFHPRLAAAIEAERVAAF